MRFERQKLLNTALVFHTNLGAQAKLKGKVGDTDKRMKTRLVGKHVKSHTLATGPQLCWAIPEAELSNALIC